MPKMKTRRSVAKRFKVTGRGKVKRGKAYASHLMDAKTPKQKRKFRKDALVSDADRERVLKGLAKK